MAQSLQVVFSDAGGPGNPVPDASFDGWYAEHLDEILLIPGFTSAQRYALEEVTKPAAARSRAVGCASTPPRRPRPNCAPRWNG